MAGGDGKQCLDDSNELPDGQQQAVGCCGTAKGVISLSAAATSGWGAVSG